MCFCGANVCIILTCLPTYTPTYLPNLPTYTPAYPSPSKPQNKNEWVAKHKQVFGSCARRRSYILQGTYIGSARTGVCVAQMLTHAPLRNKSALGQRHHGKVRATHRWARKALRGGSGCWRFDCFFLGLRERPMTAQQPTPEGPPFCSFFLFPVLSLPVKELCRPNEPKKERKKSFKKREKKRLKIKNKKYQNRKQNKKKLYKKHLLKKKKKTRKTTQKKKKKTPQNQSPKVTFCTANPPQPSKARKSLQVLVRSSKRPGAGRNGRPFLGRQRGRFVFVWRSLVFF